MSEAIDAFNAAVAAHDIKTTAAETTAADAAAVATETAKAADAIAAAPATVAEKPAEGQPAAVEETVDTDAFLAEQGGVEGIKEARQPYDIFTAPEGVDADKFWKVLAGISEKRYTEIAIDLFKAHPDVALSVAGIDKNAFQEYQQWVKAGKPAASKDGELSDAELEASDDPRDKELLESRRYRREAAKREAEFAKQREQADAARDEQEVNKHFYEFTQGHESSVDAEIAKLKLGDDPLGKWATKAIKAVALYDFFADKNSHDMYSTGTRLITKEREFSLGKKNLPLINLNQQKFTIEAIKQVSDLLQAKRDAEAAKRGQQARAGINPPAGGAVAPPATANSSTAQRPASGSNVVAFDQRDQMARLRAIKAERGL